MYCKGLELSAYWLTLWKNLKKFCLLEMIILWRVKCKLIPPQQHGSMMLRTEGTSLFHIDDAMRIENVLQYIKAAPQDIRK